MPSQILTKLVSNLTLPISAKIRLLGTQEATLDLVKQIAATGISCLTVHCRTQEMRPREPALLNRLKEIVDFMKPYGIPVVANGDCWGVKDREAICELTGVTSIMIARGAEANPSCFLPTGLLDPMDTIIPRYTRIAIATNNHFQNTKYCLNVMDLTATSKPAEAGIKAKRQKVKSEMTHLKTYEALCDISGVNYDKAKTESLDEILPGLRGRLRVEDREIEDETEEELKHKMPREVGKAKEMVDELRAEGDKENLQESEVAVQSSSPLIEGRAESMVA